MRKQARRVQLIVDGKKHPVEVLLLMKARAHVRSLGPAFRLRDRVVETGDTLMVSQNSLVFPRE